MNIRIGNIIKAGILGAAMAVLATACSNDDGSPQGRAISFDCTAESMANIWNSRAAEPETSNMASFRVWGTWRNDNQTFTQPFMTSQIVEKFGTSWAYAPTMYAPTEGSVDFIAYSPAISTGVMSFDPGSSSYQPSVKYAVPADLALQEDFMVADQLRNTSSTVNLNFKHMLAAFNFEATSTLANASFRVHRITVHNLFPQGTLNGDTSGANAVWNWTVNTSVPRSDYEVNPPSSALVASGGGAQSLNPTTGSVMALPQQVQFGIGAGQFYITVLYDAILSGTTIIENNTLTLSPTTLSNPYTFEKNNRYLFKINFSTWPSRSLSASELSHAATLEVHVSEP